MTFLIILYVANTSADTSRHFAKALTSIIKIFLSIASWQTYYITHYIWCCYIFVLWHNSDTCEAKCEAKVLVFLSLNFIQNINSKKKSRIRALVRNYCGGKCSSAILKQCNIRRTSGEWIMFYSCGGILLKIVARPREMTKKRLRCRLRLILWQVKVVKLAVMAWFLFSEWNWGYVWIFHRMIQNQIQYSLMNTCLY